MLEMTDPKLMEPSVAVHAERPLCVDLDGTLVKSDTFVDSLMVLARRRPLAFLRTPVWAIEGRAHLKSQVASHVALDVAHLPYNRPLLDYLKDERAAGRKLYLVTGADRLLAQSVAAHLGIFDEVMASDGALNLTGNNKLQHLQQRFASDGFDYIGNALPDLPLLTSARQAMVANPGLRLKSALKNRNISVSEKFLDRSSAPVALAKALRVHQWAKNLLVFLPLLLAHTIRPGLVLTTVAAFFCFSFLASATYILNDLLDLEADRSHLNKRQRAFAAGDLSVAAGLAI
jgi:phosphoserine phosphatase